jgi:hypothetical protein
VGIDGPEQGDERLTPEEAEEESRRQTEEYRQRLFVGIGVGEPITEAIRQAYDNAWRQARDAGVRGPLRVVEQQIDGYNPPDWCRVVLSAGS